MGYARLFISEIEHWMTCIWVIYSYLLSECSSRVNSVKSRGGERDKQNADAD